MNLGNTVSGKVEDNLAGKIFDVFIGKSKNEQLEFENDEHTVSKEESRVRITILQSLFSLICLISTTILICICEMIFLGKTNSDFVIGK